MSEPTATASILETTTAKPPEETIDVSLEDFLRKPEYESQFTQIGRGEQTRLIMDFMALYQDFPDYANKLLNDPSLVIKHIISAIQSRFKVVCPECPIPKHGIAVGFRNLPKLTPLVEMSQSMGKLIAFRAMLANASLPCPEIIRAHYVCKKCQSITHVPVDSDTWLISKPEICGRCRSKFFEMSPITSDYVDAQMATVQELPEDLGPEKMPSLYTIKLTRDLTNRMPLGSRVMIVGIPKPHTKKRGGDISAFLKVWLDVLWVEEIEANKEEILTPEDVAKIESTVKEEGFEKRMVYSICPSLFGLDDVKQAVLYQMLGGVNRVDEKDGTFQRGFIHVLIVGDSGTGKSTLLRYVPLILPRAMLTSAGGTTGRGLTVVIRKTDQEGTELVAGPMVLCNDSIACVDELDKMPSSDREFLNQCMDSGIISVAKGGFVTQLQARTALLAGANPIGGKFDEYNEKNLADTVNMPWPTMNRFDLIFVEKDVKDKESDSVKAKHAIRVGAGKPRETYADAFEIIFLRRFISHARQLIPTIPDNILEIMHDQYMKIRLSGGPDAPMAIGLRQLGSIRRLAEARAKLFLRSEVTAEDVEIVTALMVKSLEQAGIDVATGKVDIETIETGKPKSLRDKMVKLREIYEELVREFSTPDLDEQQFTDQVIKRTGMTVYEVEDMIRRMIRDGFFYQTKPHRIKQTSH